LSSDTSGFYQSTEVLDGLTIWRISGFLQDARVSDLKSTLQEILSHGGVNIIFDFDGLKAIDSRGLGFLISVQKELRLRSGRMVMIHLTAQFAALLELTKLNRIFEVFLDMETAKRSFGGQHLHEA
jgi:anti-sigma B factor antagonist